MLRCYLSKALPCLLVHWVPLAAQTQCPWAPPFVFQCHQHDGQDHLYRVLDQALGKKKGYNINHTMTKGGICLWFAVWILPVVKQLMGCNWWKLIFSNILKWSSFACNLQSRKSRLMESWVLVDVSHLHLHSSVNEIPTIFTCCFQSLWFRIVNYKVNMFSQSTYTCLIPYRAPQDT